ncbi:MAG TPA: carboxypeptidase regulatory-like domain-containing protein [Armatimonadota bacterium]|jgi:hypothetical protein
MLKWFVLLLTLAFGASVVLAEQVTITVLDTEGKPVAGAKVAIVRLDPTMTFIATAELVTDVMGSCTTGVTVPTASSNMMARRFVSVYKAGFALGGCALTPGEKIITLQKPIAVSGKVVDEQEKPVAGAKVQLGMVLISEKPMEVMLVPTQWQEQCTVVTDDKGQWTFSLVPATAKSGVVHLSDSRFARSTKQFVIADNQHPLLVAYPSATITGRVLAPNGKGVPGIYVSALANHDYAPCGTCSDTHGTYRIIGLQPGACQIFVQDPKKRWTANSVKDVTAVAGKETDAPDITLVEVGFIEGTVISKETAQPMADIYLTASLKKASSTQSQGWSAFTDKQGHFKFMVPPGTYTTRIIAGGLRSLKPGTAPTATVTVKAGQHVKTPPLLLPQGLSLTIRAVDAQGAPVAGVALRVRQFCKKCLGKGCQNDFMAQCAPDAQGLAVVRGLSPGNGRVELSQSLDEMGVWDLVEQPAFRLPGTTVVTVKLRKPPLITLTGRVVNTEGTPISGVNVRVTRWFMPGKGPRANRTTETTTDARGQFTQHEIRLDSEVEIQSLRCDGYAPLTLGKVTKKDGVLTVTDSVMRTCDGTLTGTVRDAAGTPVVGAVVQSLDGGPSVRATTDAQGQFSLARLPRGDVHLVAASATGGALCTGTTGSPAMTITLRPATRSKAQDTVLVFGWLEADAKLPVGKQRFVRNDLLARLAAIAPERAQQYAQADGWKIPDAVHAALAITAVTQNPEQNADLAIAQMEMTYTAAERFKLAIALGIRFAISRPPYAEHCYRVAQTQLLDKEVGQEAVSSLCVLAFMLAPKEMSALGKLNVPGKKMSQNAIYSAAAKMRPGDLRTLCLQFNRLQRAEILSQAIIAVADMDPRTARTWLDTLATFRGDNHYLVFRTACAVERALAKVDPAGALALARSPLVAVRRSYALVLAARVQPKEKAMALLREALQQDRQSGYSFPTALAAIPIAYQLDPVLGREFQDASKRIIGSDEYSRLRLTPPYVYFTNTLDPVENRLLLEQEYFAARVEKNSWRMKNQPLAMAAMDIDRAFEMLEDLRRIDQGIATRARQDILRYVLASEEERLLEFFIEE